MSFPIYTPLPWSIPRKINANPQTSLRGHISPSLAGPSIEGNVNSDALLAIPGGEALALLGQNFLHVRAGDVKVLKLSAIRSEP